MRFMMWYSIKEKSKPVNGKKSRGKLYDFMCRFLLFSACNSSKHNAKVIDRVGNRVGTYFFFLAWKLQLVFVARRIKWFLQKDLKLEWTFNHL